jgi:hypothetical protein
MSSSMNSDAQRCSLGALVHVMRRFLICQPLGEFWFFITSAAHFGDVGLASDIGRAQELCCCGQRWVHDKAIEHVQDWVSSGHITTDAGDVLAQRFTSQSAGVGIADIGHETHGRRDMQEQMQLAGLPHLVIVSSASGSTAWCPRTMVSWRATAYCHPGDDVAAIDESWP